MFILGYCWVHSEDLSLRLQRLSHTENLSPRSLDFSRKNPNSQEDDAEELVGSDSFRRLTHPGEINETTLGSGLYFEHTKVLYLSHNLTLFVMLK